MVPLRISPRAVAIAIAAGVALVWTSETTIAAAVIFGAIAVIRVRPRLGFGRLFVDQTYHHQALRALNHVHARGADISEVLETTSHIRAGDPDGWYTAWTALGDRNLARARATTDRQSRGQALLRAHTYYLRAEFFLRSDDPRRPESFARNTKAFYEGLETLDVAHERLAVPYEGHQLNAVHYPGVAPTRAPLLVFCGGIDSTMEELYFFLADAARSRGYSILTFEGPGQGSVLRDQGLRFTHEWEKPTAAVLDTYLSTHPRPDKIILIGLSMGGYLAARAAAFEARADGVVSYDVLFDLGAAVKRNAPPIAYALRRLGLERLVDVLGELRARVDPAAAWSLATGRWTVGKTRPLEVVDSFAPYSLAGVADRIRQDVLMFAGDADQFIPVEQVELYKRALVNARSVTAVVYDRVSGGSEHSQLGASTLWQADLFDWLEQKFG